MENVAQYQDTAVKLGLEYGPKLILALVTLAVGWWLSALITRALDRILKKGKVDDTLRPFLESLALWGLRTLLLISVASMVGIETTSFIAVLGAAGLAVGLALQGSLANFAGGALILAFRPFEVGDVIEAQGHLGVVQRIQIFNTILVSPQGRRIVVPNGPLSNGSLINHTREGKARVDLTIGIAYGSNIAIARQALMTLMQDNELILSDPAPSVTVSELGDSAVKLAVRPWCKPEHYWEVYSGTLEASKLALDACDVAFPSPPREVRLVQS
jgi:small conductance mechanosensitive channel